MEICLQICLYLIDSYLITIPESQVDHEKNIACLFGIVDEINPFDSVKQCKVDLRKKSHSKMLSGIGHPANYPVGL